MESVENDEVRSFSADNRLITEIRDKTPEEIYDFLYVRMKKYGLSFTNSRNAIIDWLNGETRYDYLLGDEFNPY